MGRLLKNIQLLLEFLKAQFLVNINDLSDDVICDIAICADVATLSCKCN